MEKGSDISVSYWEKCTFYGHYDILIVGAGLTALHSAIQIKQRRPEISVLIVERHSIPQGAATRNAGFACFGSPSELLADFSKMSDDEVFSLVKRRQRGLTKLRQLVGDQNLGYLENGGYEVFTDDMKDTYQKCLDRLPYLNDSLGKEIYQAISKEHLSNLGLKGFSAGIYIEGEGMLHTGKMVSSLLKLAHECGVQFLWGISVTSFESSDQRVKLFTDKGTFLTSSRAVLATNAFAKELIPGLPINPVRNQVLVTSKFKHLTVSGSFHYDAGYIYFRSVDNRMLIGGARNRFRSEAVGVFGITDELREYLYRFLKKHLMTDEPFSIEYHWSGILGMGPSKKPILKDIDDRILYIGRLAGMGVAISSLVGEEVALHLLEKDSPILHG